MITKPPMIYKSNALTEASFRLSIAEQRILLSCISQIRRDESVTDELLYSVSAAELAKASGTSSKQAYRELEKAALRLKRREVRIICHPNGNGARKKIMVANWVQSIFYIENEGRVELRFCKDMLPYLSQLSKEFTRYALSNVMKMTSSYAIRLYELLMQWENIGERELGITWLRSALQLESSYLQLKDLKRRVIEPAISQINEYSDLKVSHTYIKTGRKITHVRLMFQKKSKQPQQKKHISKSEIAKQALPGESWEEARDRLKNKIDRCSNTIDMF